MAMEVEDDAFFADLSKQIALLIMDDDDQEFPVQRPSLPIQGFPYIPQTIMPPPSGCEVAYRRESKGTGVFIPRSTLPRGKNKPGRSTPINTNSHKQPAKPGGAVSSVSSNKNIICSSYYSNSAVLKRHN
ncbi:uncharacterized protein LOC103712332 [Phoenix dactylifera]|uniref:Uncharacterized protein LOC103712332 n=1 Tax=Phoenix dactylifera TaxID=42345 RepID=A0A8B7CDN8_PHODC|nr:uncharacterized protein LOC103712332 [Phoenix dactylifera]